jgi:hypothetical protein
VCLSGSKVRIHTSGFSGTIEAHICRKRQKIKFYGSKSQGTTKEFERLTLQGFPKTLDLLEKEFFAIRSMRRLGQSNADLRGNCF